MKRDAFIKAVGLGTASLALAPLVGCASRGDKPPNIVFIMADDLGYGDTGCYNADCIIPTPNIDKLATEGIMFTDAHTPSSVCSPTRYGLLTGRYAWRTRLQRFALIGYSPPLMEPNETTVADLLKQRGYKTACIGKWHVGLEWAVKEGEQVDFHRPLNWGREYMQEVGNKVDYTKPVRQGPVDHGFDYFYGTAGCSTTDPPYVFIENDQLEGIPSVVRPDYMQCDEGLMVPDWKQEVVDTVYVEKSIEFMEQNRRNPFFLYLPLSSPHAPWLPPDLTKGTSGTGARGDMVAWVDWSVGQITAALKRLGLEEDTLLIFTSDNGPREGKNGHKSAGDLRGLKGSVHEGGHRVPFIARWPGKIEEGSTSDETICLTDLTATCGDLLDIPLKAYEGVDSISILPALLGEKIRAPLHRTTIHHSAEGDFAIREGDWKLIEGHRRSINHPGFNSKLVGQLYNLKDDPAERNNLWDARPDKVSRMLDLLDEIRRQGYSRDMRG